MGRPSGRTHFGTINSRTENAARPLCGDGYLHVDIMMDGYPPSALLAGADCTSASYQMPPTMPNHNPGYGVQTHTHPPKVRLTRSQQIS